jgi:HAMP domain-containing protein
VDGGRWVAALAPRQPWLAFVIAAAAGAGLAGIAAFLIAGAVARPIRRVALASRRLAAGERPGPLPVEGSDEVASLTAAFNPGVSQSSQGRGSEPVCWLDNTTSRVQP